MDTNSSKETWLSIGEACRILGVSEATLRQWTDDRQIRVFITPGGHRRYERKQLEEFMDSRRNVLGMKDLIARLEDTAAPHREIGSSFSSPANASVKLDESQKRHLAHLGRNLLDLIIAYVSEPDKRDEIMLEAGSVGQSFGTCLAEAELSLTDSIQSFIAHRRPIIDGVMTMMKQREIVAEEILACLPLIDNIIDQTLLELTRAYQNYPRS
ncbi:MAG: helix-turn-helix domain-containing protein [Dehalococcoidaceae bacterium]|nr:helix-turn-helix domain-containing protein [Dehalococcoidaceae bacterium]